MPNNNVLAAVIERLDAQVTLDTPTRDAWMKALKKHHKDMTALRSRLLSDSARIGPEIDELALEWARSGQFPKPRQDAEWDNKCSFLRQRIHRAHIFAKWLEASGFQICGTSEEDVCMWLLTEFWKIYGQMAWLETIASSV